jgi:hypothetical protein
MSARISLEYIFKKLLKQTGCLSVALVLLRYKNDMGKKNCMSKCEGGGGHWPALMFVLLAEQLVLRYFNLKT